MKFKSYQLEKLDWRTAHYTMELAKSNRSFCILCHNRIKKGIPRLMDRFNKFICHNCGSDLIEDGIIGLGRLSEQWEKFLEKHSKEIVMANLK